MEVKSGITKPLMRLGPKTEKYLYEPLKSETSIRILELLPGEGQGLIRCQLHIVEVGQGPQYEALSYAWGSATDKREISCDGRKLKIPTSLRDALWRVRDSVKTRRFWADAICINQSDYLERGHQVKQMALIYSTAERVLVWLGPNNPFEFFGDLVEEQVSTLTDHFFGRIKDTSNQESSRSSTPESDVSLESYNFWSGFSELLDRPWFSRLWVVQEVGLARSALALFGDKEIDFDHLILLIKKVRNYLEWASYFRIDVDCAAVFSLFPNRIQKAIGPTERDFLEVLEVTRTQLASDPRDYIYALLGHPSALINGTPFMEPDYHRGDSETFYELAIKLIEYTQSLRILSAVRHSSQDDLTNEYPSWVPTWNRDNFVNHFGVFREFCSHRNWDAAAGSSGSWRVIEPKKILQVQGFTLDTIGEHTTEIEVSFTKRMADFNLIHVSPIETALAFRGLSISSIPEWLYELSLTLTAGGYVVNPNHAEDKELLRDFAAFRLNLSNVTFDQDYAAHSNLIPEGLAALRAAAKGGDRNWFQAHAENWIYGKKLFCTRNGTLGIGPGVLQSGDICCILFGVSVPIILRPVGLAYRLVGEAYIHKVMQGEAMVDFVIGGKFRAQDFDIF